MRVAIMAVTADLTTVAVQLNPLRLLQRFESLKNRVAAIRNRSEAIADRKQVGCSVEIELNALQA